MIPLGKKLTGEGVARSVGWNVGGALLPFIAAVVAIPPIVSGLDPQAFGVLGIIWAIAGYFSILDLGVGRALTRYVADHLGRGETSQSRLATRTAIVLLSSVGVLGGALLVIISPWLAHDLLNLSGTIGSEAALSFALVGLSMPAVLVTTAHIGFLESYQRFDLVNAVRIPYGASTFVVPAILVSIFSAGLVPVVASIVALRMAALLAYWWLAYRAYPPRVASGFFNATMARELLRFGGWLTISKLATPFLTSSDRIVIGALLSVSAAGIYTPPYEVATRLLVIPVAVSSVTFSAMAATMREGGAKPARILAGSLYTVLAMIVPLALLLSAYAPELLKAWLGGAFTTEMALVVQVLMIGVLANSIASPLFASVLAADRADWTAKLHVAEVPLYIAALLVLVPSGGIVAAAWIWTARTIVDAGAMALLSGRTTPIHSKDRKAVLALALVSIVALLVTPQIGNGVVRGCAVLLALLALFRIIWSVGLRSSERGRIQQSLYSRARWTKADG